MAYQVLEVTLVSAKDLKKVTLFSRMRVYAVASISGGDPRTPMHRTRTDREGGRSPMWHAPLRFVIPAGADPRGLALHVLLRAERAFGDRDVGEVFVPLPDLLAPAAVPDRGGNRRLVRYTVRRPVTGRKCGVLNLSYRVSDEPDAAVAAPRPYAQYQRPLKGVAEAVPAYPPYHHPYGAAAYPHRHPYGYGAVRPSYGYGYGTPAARHDGGMGLGLLGGAVGGMMLSDMVAVAEMDAAYDAGHTDGMGF